MSFVPTRDGCISPVIDLIVFDESKLHTIQQMLQFKMFQSQKDDTVKQYRIFIRQKLMIKELKAEN